MITSTTARKAKAEADFQIALTIAAGGSDAAYVYARKWFHENESKISEGFRLNEAARASYIRTIANGALGCAVNIAKDGRAFYEDAHGLIVCTLSADASAGPVGYDRW